MTPQRALLATVALLAVADVVRSAWLPDSFHLAFNLALAASVAALAWAGGLSRDELGLCALRPGLAWGAAAFAIVTGVVIAAAVIAPTWSVFDDPRVELSGTDLALKVLITIPLGTVLLEELAFRGSLLAFLRKLTGAGSAAIISSVLFGLWHVPGAWKSSGNPGELSQVAESTLGRLATVLGVVIATTAAGSVFAWLRIRSGSLLSPALAHIATNSVVLTVAWVVAR